jgi:SAM-dependent methyltransferase
MPPIQTSIGIRRKAFLRFIESHQRLDRASANRSFYDRLWTRSNFISPHRFNTWPIVRPLADRAEHRLEVGPGLHPRLPIKGTHFFDISDVPLRQLAGRGGLTHLGDATSLPYADRSFDLVCALDIIEHIADDHAAFAQLRRILRPGGKLLLAVPLHPDRWTTFDTVVGHARRYTREELLAILEDHDLTLESSALYGMQARSRYLCDLTALGFWRVPRATIFIYNHIVMPLGLLRQMPLHLSPGLIDTSGVDEVLLICRAGHDTPRDAP